MAITDIKLATDSQNIYISDIYGGQTCFNLPELLELATIHFIKNGTSTNFLAFFRTVFTTDAIKTFEFVVSKGVKYIQILENSEIKFYPWEKYKNAFQQAFPVSKDQGIRTVRNSENAHKTIEALSFGNLDFLTRIICTNDRIVYFAIGNRIFEYSVDKWAIVNQIYFKCAIKDFEYDESEHKLFVLLEDSNLVLAGTEIEKSFDTSIFKKIESDSPQKQKFDQNNNLLYVLTSDVIVCYNVLLGVPIKLFDPENPINSISLQNDGTIMTGQTNHYMYKWKLTNGFLGSLESSSCATNIIKEIVYENHSILQTGGTRGSVDVFVDNNHYFSFIVK